ncbi:MAG TPA: hypothetical protein ENK48_04340, partial [Gammaproteobacteria bacterium]|nr:hypothetical protein [Gammaproteobacteria bacterium]
MNTSTPSSPAVSGAGPHHPDDPGEIMNIARPRRAPVSGRCLVTYWALACALLLLSACGGGGGGEGDSANDEMPVVATASIGNAGGAVASADGAITLTIPAGALSDEQRITVSAVNVRSLPPEFADLPAANIGKVYELQPDGLRFDKPIVIRIALNADPDLGFAPGNLLTSSGSVVEALDKQQIIVDADSGTVVLQGELSHFSPLVHNLFGGLKIRALWPKPRFTYPVQQDIPVTLEFEANARNKLFRVGADFLYTDQSQSPLAMVASGTDKDGRPILNKDDKGRPILETRFSADNLSDEAKPEAFSRHRLVYRCDEISEKVPYQAELALSNIALTPLDRSTPEDRAFIDQVGKFLAFASPKVTFKQAVNCVGRPFTVGGNVSGLDGTVTLQMRTGAGDAETLSIGQNGPFVFKQTVGDGLSWTVAVTAQPDNQVCSASPTGGRIAGVDVTNVAVVCEDRAKYRIGGDIGGLGGGTSVGLKLTAEDGTTSTIVASVNGFFYFDKMVATGTGYQVAITQQPTDQACRVENASGVVEDTDVNNVKVSCFVDTYTIGGTLTGLKNTESVDLALSTDSFVSRTENLLLRQNGPFVFSTKYPIVEGDGYIVYVALQPPTQKCTVSNGEGTVQNANVDNVVVTCIDRLGDGTWTTGLIGGDADPIGGHSLDFWVDLMIKTGSTQT